MRPKPTPKVDHDDLFRARLDSIINMRHELGEYPKLCVSGLAHSGFRYGHVLKRSAYSIAN